VRSFLERSEPGFEFGGAALIMVDDRFQLRLKFRRQRGDLFGRDGRRGRRPARDVAEIADRRKINFRMRLLQARTVTESTLRVLDGNGLRCH
jgi:hypothetical protein